MDKLNLNKKQREGLNNLVKWANQPDQTVEKWQLHFRLLADKLRQSSSDKNVLTYNEGIDALITHSDQLIADVVEDVRTERDAQIRREAFVEGVEAERERITKVAQSNTNKLRIGQNATARKHLKLTEKQIDEHNEYCDFWEEGYKYAKRQVLDALKQDAQEGLETKE
jgi:hypothetical protein